MQRLVLGIYAYQNMAIVVLATLIAAKDAKLIHAKVVMDTLDREPTIMVSKEADQY